MECLLKRMIVSKIDSMIVTIYSVFKYSNQEVTKYISTDIETNHVK